MRFHRLVHYFILLTLAGVALIVYAGTALRHPFTAIGRNGSYNETRIQEPPQRQRGTLDDVVLSEDFETIAPGQLPAGWMQVDRDSGYCSWFDRLSTWEVYARSGFSAHEGTRFAMCYFNDHALPNNDWLILPQQTVTGTITLSYWIASQDPAYPESFEVRVSTGGVQPEDFTHLIFSDTSVVTDWAYHAHDLSAFAGVPFRVAFHYNSTDRFALKVDDVQLEASGALTGSIRGTVSDDSGYAISYASAQIFSIGHAARTDSIGGYALRGIPVGTYTVFISDEFHSPNIAPNVVVRANDSTLLDATLTPLPRQFAHYVSLSNPRHIADFDTCNMLIIAQDTVVIHDIDVTLTLNHTRVGDLDIWLRSPDSIWVKLIAHDSLNFGHNMTDCRFDDQADLPVAAGQAPYTGRFRPVESLGRFNGDSLIHYSGHYPVGGYWLLYVYDAFAGDEGTLTGFSMDVAWETPLSTDRHSAPMPMTFSFDGNYPNPFNSETHFRFTLPSTSRVELTLYNLLGQEAARVVDGVLEAGQQDVSFDASGLSSGLYFAKLKASGYTATRKVLLLK